MMWYCLGRMVKHGELLTTRWWNDIYKNRSFLYTVFFAMCFVVSVYFDFEINYWYRGATLMELIALVAVLFIAKRCCKYQIVKWIGRNTLLIYLIHMPLAGIIVFLTQSASWLLLFRPVIVIAVCCAAIAILQLVANKYLKNSAICQIVGVQRKD